MEARAVPLPMTCAQEERKKMKKGRKKGGDELNSIWPALLAQPPCRRFPPCSRSSISSWALAHLQSGLDCVKGLPDHDASHAPGDAWQDVQHLLG